MKLVIVLSFMAILYTCICSTQYANSRNLQISGRNLPIVILLTQFDNFYIRCLLLSKLLIEFANSDHFTNSKQFANFNF